MKRHLLVVALLLIGILLACGESQSPGAPTFLPPPSRTPVPFTRQPTSIPVAPTETATLFPTLVPVTLVPTAEPSPTLEPTPPAPTATTPAAEPSPLPTETTQPATAEPTAEPTSAPALQELGPGTYLVGTDIQPGIYRGEAGQGILLSCYWARLSDLSGNLDAILANDNAVGQFYIEVKVSDAALTTDCELVALDSLPAPQGNLPQAIEPGMYLVGRDILPGTYRGEAGQDILESCYWARLSDVSGSSDAILANDNAVGQFFIEVAASDFALKTGCQLNRIGE